MSTAKRMKEARLAAHLSQGKVAKLLGVSRSAVFHWETEGESHTFPATEHLLKCAKLYNKSPEWLIFGDSFLEKNKVKSQFSETSKTSKTLKVPVISWELAKKGKLAVLELPHDHAEYVLAPSETPSPLAFALKIENDSMLAPSPTSQSFKQGEYIVIDPEITEIESNKFGLFLQQEAPTPIFRQFVNEGKASYLKPLNPQYPMIEINEKIKALGKAIFQINVL